MSFTISKEDVRVFNAVVDKNMPDYSNEPCFIKQAKEGDAFLSKVGLPPGVEKRNGFLVVVSPLDDK